MSKPTATLQELIKAKCQAMLASLGMLNQAPADAPPVDPAPADAQNAADPEGEEKLPDAQALATQLADAQARVATLEAEAQASALTITNLTTEKTNLLNQVTVITNQVTEIKNMVSGDNDGALPPNAKGTPVETRAQKSLKMAERNNATA